VLTDQLQQLSQTLGKVDADLRMRCAAIEDNNERTFAQLSTQLDKLDAEVSKAKSADGVSLRDKCILVAKFDKLDTTVRKQIEDADKVHSAKLDGYHTLSKQQVTEIKKALEKLDAVYQQRVTTIEDTIKRQVTQLVQSLGNVDSEFRKLLAQAGIMNWLEGGQTLQQPSAANDMWSENTVVYKYDLQTLAMNLNSRLEKHERQLVALGRGGGYNTDS
jgi:hypothetical protein